MEEEKKQQGKRKEHKKSWQETYASIDDIKRFLLERVMLRYNVITKQTEVHVIEQAPKPPEEATARPEDYLRWLKEWQEWIKPTAGLPSLSREGQGEGLHYELLTDHMENTLYTELKAQKEVRMQDLHSVIESDFVPEYHPFRQYLERLPPWREDDADHIMALSLSVNVKGDADEQLLFYEYLKKMPAAMALQIVGANLTQKLRAVILGRAFVALGYRYVTIKGSRHYLVVRRTADEMRVMRQTAGGGDGGDGGAVF